MTEQRDLQSPTIKSSGISISGDFACFSVKIVWFAYLELSAARTNSLPTQVGIAVDCGDLSLKFDKKFDWNKI
jgi:hypothetical protein